MGWWFQIFFNVHPDPWGNDPISRAYFSIGLKPPTSKDGVVPTMKHLDSGGNLKHVCFCLSLDPGDMIQF